MAENEPPVRKAPVTRSERQEEPAPPYTGEPSPDDVELRASQIVIASFEREATEARENADDNRIQEVQERYHDERMKRAKQELQRESESE
jgi:hypothetical protein